MCMALIPNMIWLFFFKKDLQTSTVSPHLMLSVDSVILSETAYKEMDLPQPLW